MANPHENTGRDSAWTAALELAKDPPSSTGRGPGFGREAVIERAATSARTADGVLATMVKHGWLFTGRNSGTYHGTTALLGEPDGDVLSVLPKDSDAAVDLATVAERLGTDRPTALAALRGQTGVSSSGLYGGWFRLDY